MSAHLYIYGKGFVEAVSPYRAQYTSVSNRSRLLTKRDRLFFFFFFFFFCVQNRALARLFFFRFFAVLRFQKKISRGEILGRGYYLQGIFYGAKPD